MQKLLTYLNSLPTASRSEFVSACGTTEGYLRKAISAGQMLGETLCIAIELHSHDEVTVKDLRPELAHALDSARYIRASNNADIVATLKRRAEAKRAAAQEVAA